MGEFGACYLHALAWGEC